MIFEYKHIRAEKSIMIIAWCDELWVCNYLELDSSAWLVEPSLLLGKKKKVSIGKEVRCLQIWIKQVSRFVCCFSQHILVPNSFERLLRSWWGHNVMFTCKTSWTSCWKMYLSGFINKLEASYLILLQYIFIISYLQSLYSA